MTESPHDGGRDDEPDDPGRDPVGLNPPRDFIDAPGSVGAEGSYTPQRPSRAERQAGKEPDEPPTSTGTGGP